MRPTAASTSSTARSTSTPVRRLTMTEASPSAAIAVTSFTPSSAATCSSILSTIDSSTSSGVAPGYATRISTASKASTEVPS